MVATVVKEMRSMCNSSLYAHCSLCNASMLILVNTCCLHNQSLHAQWMGLALRIAGPFGLQLRVCVRLEFPLLLRDAFNKRNPTHLLEGPARSRLVELSEN